ncbi:MAG: SDR family NAD(P)-dependent oxidoreductase [Halioglobus sp.]|nr:SDR family NAD(P)-dependent oxidoreductase [Halioglobus sp.]
MDKIVVITGAADGLGKAFTTRFAVEGYQVVAADINDEAGEALAVAVEAKGGKVVYRHCDVTQKEQVLALLSDATEQFGAVHVLINNAVPLGTISNIEEKADEEFQRQLDGGLFAARWAMNAVFDSMKAQCFGRIINLCSLNGVNAHPQTSDYNIAKEALRCLTRSAAVEWAPYGITVNAICPGAKTAAFRSMQEFAPEMAARVNKQIPMGYMGDPYEDISGVALFLASKEARYMTGNTLYADGGGHINGINWASLFD